MRSHVIDSHVDLSITIDRDETGVLSGSSIDKLNVSVSWISRGPEVKLMEDIRTYDAGGDDVTKTPGRRIPSRSTSARSCSCMSRHHHRWYLHYHCYLHWCFHHRCGWEWSHSFCSWRPSWRPVRTSTSSCCHMYRRPSCRKPCMMSMEDPIGREGLTDYRSNASDNRWR